MSTNTTDETVPYPIPARFEKEDRPEFVELLKEAKKYLSRRPPEWGRYVFICWAIDYAAQVLNTPYGVHSELLDRIRQVLEVRRTWTLTLWLYKQKRFSDMPETKCRYREQDARHRWVDQMIVDFGGTP